MQSVIASSQWGICMRTKDTRIIIMISTECDVVTKTDEGNLNQKKANCVWNTHDLKKNP